MIFFPPPFINPPAFLTSHKLIRNKEEKEKTTMDNITFLFVFSSKENFKKMKNISTHE